jgi:protein tyrosine phosphatase (PTP) superfamily phosphohydrolase (DUF442 family)
MRGKIQLISLAVLVLVVCLASVSSLSISLAPFDGQDAAKKQYVCPPCGCSGDDATHDQPGSCSACGMALVEKNAGLGELKSIPSFLRLNDKVWTGGQPTLDHLVKLKEEGVKVIINLRPHSEHDGEREVAKAKELGLRYFNVPVVYNQPKDEDAAEFLKVTDEQLKGEPAFIHCTAAIRVGAFWMIRRVLRDGWDYEKALEEANRIGLRNRPHLVEFARGYIERHRKK